MKYFMVFLTFFLSSQLLAGEILTATVARIKNHVVTSREVQMQFILDKTLKNESLVYHDKDPVEQLVREWLLYFEAKNFYASKLSSNKKAVFFKKASQSLRTLSEWKKLGVTSSELKAMLDRKLEAKRLFLFKKEASILPVSDSEIEAEYKQNRIRYGTLSFDQVKAKIKKRKTEENLGQRLNNWFEVLEKKYRVQRFAKYNKAP